MVRKSPLALSAALSLAFPLAVVLLVAGCGEDKKEQAAAPRPPRKDGALPPTKKSIDAPYDGVVKGRVVLDGTAPQMQAIKDMQEHQDKKVCLAADATEEEKLTQQWKVSKDNGVANVVIKIVPFKKTEEFKKVEPATTEVEIDQPHCAFVPHVVAVAPGQTLVVKNSAPVPHNMKLSGNPLANKERSEAIPPSKSVKVTLNPQKEPVNLGCDFHKWMNAQVHVVDTPFVAVTKDDGTFEITGVPTGVDLMVIGVHEAGDVEGAKDGMKVKFDKGPNELKLKVKPR